MAGLPGLGLAEAMEAETPSGWYVGTSGGMLLPGNGNSLRRAAEIAVRGGHYFSDYFALELEGVCVPSAVSGRGGNATVSGALVEGVCHMSGWEAFDRLFGCERFDPFVSMGAAARFASRDVFAHDARRTAIGPMFGLGAFYHLTDSWSLRGDLRAQLCCDSPCGMLYSVSLGVQYSWGEGL